MSKPILFLDIDGVLFGQYGDPPCRQLRPGVGSFLRWAQEHFEFWWSSGWSPDDIQCVARLCYWPTVEEERFKPQGVSKLRYVRETLSAEQPSYWVWVEDEDFRECQPRLNRIASGQCVQVNPDGRDALETVRQRLQELLNHAT